MEHPQLVDDVQRLTESLGQLPEPVVKPAFIVVSGLPGTGKSYFCSRLAERLPFVILESDALRKVLFSPPSYSPKESQYLFQAVHLLIERLLKKGISLILDATNLSERHREYLYNIADRLGVELILVRVEAPPEVVRARMIAEHTRLLRHVGVEVDEGVPVEISPLFALDEEQLIEKADLPRHITEPTFFG